MEEVSMEEILSWICSNLSGMKRNSFSRKDIYKHWSKNAVFTGNWDMIGCRGKKVKEEELLQGELYAYVYQVGCYIVRSACRVYKIYEPGYSPEEEQPASTEEVEMVKKDMVDEERVWIGFCSWKDELRITNEISAKHYKDSKTDFKYICRATEARNHRWSETISCICAAKKHMFMSNQQASLFVCNTYMGDSFSSDTWYKLSADGKIKSMRLHPYDGDVEKARFV